jgi:hypothetical protein
MVDKISAATKAGAAKASDTQRRTTVTASSAEAALLVDRTDGDTNRSTSAQELLLPQPLASLQEHTTSQGSSSRNQPAATQQTQIAIRPTSPRQSAQKRQRQESLHHRPAADDTSFTPQHQLQNYTEPARFVVPINVLNNVMPSNDSRNIFQHHRLVSSTDIHSIAPTVIAQLLSDGDDGIPCWKQVAKRKRQDVRLRVAPSEVTAELDDEVVQVNPPERVIEIFDLT